MKVDNIFAESVDPPILDATTSVNDRRMGLLTSTTDPNGAKTSTGYDVFGRRTSVTTPLDQGYPATAQYAYTLGTTGTPSKVQVKVRRDTGSSATPDYQYAWYFYDGMGRFIQKQTQAVNTNQFILVNTAYDQRGKVKWVSQPYSVTSNGSTIVFGQYVTPDWNNPKFLTEYDAIGRTKKVTNPDGTYSTTAYDHWLTTSTDENGHKKDFLSDAFGRTTRVREYQSGAWYATTTYGYDLIGRLVDTWDNSNNNTHLTYDWLGRKMQLQDPDMGTWNYEYDNASNLLRQTNARSNSVCFVYDDLNRVTTKTARTGTDCNASISYTVNYSYDDYNGTTQFGRGRRTSMTDPNGLQSWVYDKQGRVTSTSQAINGAPANPYDTSFTYDAMDRARTMTYPDGEVVIQVYNNQGLLQSMSSNDSIPASISTVSYNAASQITLLPFGNGATTNYTYDAQDQRLTDIVTTKSGTTLLNVHYTFDNVGNILSAQDNIGTAGTTNYGYDDLNRLLSASVTNGANQYSRSWTYNQIGNTQTRVEQGVTTSYTYDTDHKHAVAQAGTGKYFCYDANGNMTRRNATTSSCTDGDLMSYDVENRMTSMVTASGTTSFAYNGDGARVSRTVATGTTYYIGNYYEIWKPAGSATFNKYYYFGANRVATRINGTLFYMQGDHLGSSTLLMTSDGGLQTRQAYFPYGDKRLADGSALPAGMDTTFTGQKSDDSTGLMYYGSRYYDTTLGRFTQADTIVPNPYAPQSLNRYSYVRNNPINFVDPTGHEDCAPEDDWCWQNRWFEAHGQCWSDAQQNWSKACEPEFQDPGILAEVLGEEGGMAIVQRANPIKVVSLFLLAFLQQRLPASLPNMLILGVGTSGNFYAAYGAIGPQWVFDFKHNQIQYFTSVALGGGAGLGFSFGVQFGVGWCNSDCNSVGAYTGAFAGGGGSFLSHYGVGGGLDYAESGNFGASNPNAVQTLIFSLILGTPGAEVHLDGSYSVAVENSYYSPGTDAGMFFATRSIVYGYTSNWDIANLYASWAFIVAEQP